MTTASSSLTLCNKAVIGHGQDFTGRRPEIHTLFQQVSVGNAQLLHLQGPGTSRMTF